MRSPFAHSYPSLHSRGPVLKKEKEQIKKSTDGDILMSNIQSAQRWLSHPVQPWKWLWHEQTLKAQQRGCREDRRSCQSTFLFGSCFHRLSTQILSARSWRSLFPRLSVFSLKQRAEELSLLILIFSHLICSQSQSFQALISWNASCFLSVQCGCYFSA